MAGKARKELNQTIKSEGEKAAFDTGEMDYRRAMAQASELESLAAQLMTQAS